jgi:hypothetical protein
VTRNTQIATQVRMLASVDDDTVARVSAPAVRRALFDSVVASPKHLEHRPIRHAWWRQPAVLVGAAAALVGSTAFVIVALNGPAPRDLPATECVFQAGVDEVTDATTGDPVADCATLWQREHGTPAPPLKAYSKGGMVFLVQLANAPAPDGFTAVTPGIAQDTRLIELNEALGDYVDGLNAACYSSTAATAKTGAELNRLGLTGWTTRTRPPAADGATSCANSFVPDPISRTVEIISNPATGLGGDPQGATLARQLRRIAASCTNLPQAAAQVRAAARALGMSETDRGLGNIVIDEVASPSLSCTRIYLTVGGTRFITLRGPTGR